jgi:hypothetical protein
MDGVRHIPRLLCAEMLDFGHRTVLKSVASGRATRASPALANLVAAGLVRETGGRHVVTDAGRVALEAGKTTRVERIGWPVAWVCLVIVAVASVLDFVLT